MRARLRFLSRRRPSRASVLRTAAATAAGVASWTSFPPLSWWWAAPIGCAGLFLAVRGARWRVAALVGTGYGLGLFVPMLNFLRGLGLDAWLVVAAIESLWFALLAVGVAIVQRRSWWPWALPFVWIADEWVRDRWPWGGFPWGRIAFGEASGPVLPLAAWGGAPLVGFAVVAVGAAVAWAVVARPRRLLAGGAVVLTLAVVGATPAAVQVPTRGTSAGGAPPTATVAAVQGDVPRLGLDAFTQRRVVTANHLRETQRLAAEVAAGRLPAPRFVVWPENASDQDPYTDPPARLMVEEAVAAVRVPILVGAVIDGPDANHVQNAGIVWSADGPGERYVKQHLVPFGEYLPLRGLMTRLVGRFSLIPRDFAPGTRPGVLHIAGITIGDVICYEVADDQVVREGITGGGRLLVVQTNNASYERPGDTGRGGETAQQLQMSRLRAVEHGRSVVVAATSGVSAMIWPDGSVRMRSGVFVPASLVATLPLRDPRTVADTLGAWPERGAAALGLLAVLAAFVPRRRSTAAVPPAPPAATPPVLTGTSQ